MTPAYINRIATSVPPHDVHRPFIEFAEGMLPQGTMRSLFRRMVRMSAIEHRYSFLQPIAGDNGDWRDSENLYATGSFPGTARRMQAFEKFAPQLAACALNKLGLTAEERTNAHTTALRWQSPVWEQRPLKQPLMIEIRFD